MSSHTGYYFTITLPQALADQKQHVIDKFHSEYPGCSVDVTLSESEQFPELTSAEAPPGVLTPELGAMMASSAGSFLHHISRREE